MVSQRVELYTSTGRTLNLQINSSFSIQLTAKTKRPRKRSLITYMCLANWKGLTRLAQKIGIKLSLSSNERPRKRHRHLLMHAKKILLTKDLIKTKRMR